MVPVSKVIDATWEAPDGSVVALDGVLDSFYQEVYLDPESKVDIERLVQHVSPDGLENYLDQIGGEIAKYSAEGHENYGKVAKRLYNITRILRRDADASYLRQLFDDPPARLYQVGGTMHALSEAIRADRLDRETIVAQLAALEGTIADCYSGRGPRRDHRPGPPPARDGRGRAARGRRPHRRARPTPRSAATSSRRSRSRPG